MCSDQCTSSFPDVNSHEGVVNQYSTVTVTTILFPKLRFGCTGKIVRMKVARSRNRNQQEPPKIQIWRENETQPGDQVLYYKIGLDLPIVNSDSLCTRARYSDGIFRCTLNEPFQVSVQLGDILGLELPPENDIYFMSTEGQTPPVNYYEFKEKLDSTVNISQGVHQTNGIGLAQINLLVILGTPP